MIDDFDTQTIEMFPIERAQAVFQEWMRPFSDDACSQCEQSNEQGDSHE
ncbi:MAG: hypothetical protein JHC38_08560 [Thiotrichales bacterium]|jgi:hypothetical protein|nr:hypothetical protein [Thiotrichales bacterium]